MKRAVTNVKDRVQRPRSGRYFGASVLDEARSCRSTRPSRGPPPLRETTAFTRDH